MILRGKGFLSPRPHDESMRSGSTAPLEFLPRPQKPPIPKAGTVFLVDPPARRRSTGQARRARKPVLGALAAMIAGTGRFLSKYGYLRGLGFSRRIAWRKARWHVR